MSFGSRKDKRKNLGILFHSGAWFGKKETGGYLKINISLDCRWPI
jgi:hypothetical protein